MYLRVYEYRRRWFWKLIDKRDRIVAKSPKGYRTFSLAKDYARFTMQGLQNCFAE